MGAMVLPPSIDPAPYVQPPHVTVRSGLSLAKMLLRLLPARPGPGVIGAAQRLRLCALELDGQWRASKKAKRAQDVRPLDQQLDRVWAVIESGLERYAVLRAHSANRKRAAALHEELFSEGLSFLELRYVEEHAESNLRLEIIEDEGLRADLDHLVGKRFMTELVAAHEHYGAVLGITEVPEDETSKISMLERLRELTQAISDYALQVLAFSRMHPDNLAPAEQALAPIDAFRQAARRAASKGAKAGDGAVSVEEEYELPEGAPAPDSPVPVVAEE